MRQGQVVRAALDLVGRRGTRAPTAAARGAEVGVVPSATYRHFRGKGEASAAALALIRKRLVENTRLVCGDGSDAEGRLRLLHLLHVSV